MNSIKSSISMEFHESMLEGTSITVHCHTLKEGVGRGMERARKKSSSNKVRYNAEKFAENIIQAWKMGELLA